MLLISGHFCPCEQAIHRDSSGRRAPTAPAPGAHSLPPSWGHLRTEAANQPCAPAPARPACEAQLLDSILAQVHKLCHFWGSTCDSQEGDKHA